MSAKDFVAKVHAAAEEMRKKGGGGVREVRTETKEALPKEVVETIERLRAAHENHVAALIALRAEVGDPQSLEIMKAEADKAGLPVETYIEKLKAIELAAQFDVMRARRQRMGI